MYYHFNSIRKYTVALLETFGDVEIPRYDEEGQLIKVINVPIVFSTRERAVQLIEQDYATNNGTANILPRLALSLDSMNKATNRDTNKTKKINVITKDDKNYTFHYNSVSYDLSFTLHILARTMSDLTLILEQILPQFRPTLNIRLQELDFIEEDTTIPINFDGVSFDFPVDTDIDSDIRTLTADLSLTMRGNLYLPIKDAKIIKEVYATLQDANGDLSTTAYKAYDDDTVLYTKNDIIN